MFFSEKIIAFAGLIYKIAKQCLTLMYRVSS
jgi:hypothetical protein